MTTSRPRWKSDALSTRRTGADGAGVSAAASSELRCTVSSILGGTKKDAEGRILVKGTSGRGRGSETQVGLLDVRAREQAGARALEHQAAVLEHVAAMRELQRARHVLLDDHDGGAGGVDALERLED